MPKGRDIDSKVLASAARWSKPKLRKKYLYKKRLPTVSEYLEQNKKARKDKEAQEFINKPKSNYKIKIEKTTKDIDNKTKKVSIITDLRNDSKHLAKHNESFEQKMKHSFKNRELSNVDELAWQSIMNDFDFQALESKEDKKSTLGANMDDIDDTGENEIDTKETESRNLSKQKSKERNKEKEKEREEEEEEDDDVASEKSGVFGSDIDDHEAVDEFDKTIEIFGKANKLDEEKDDNLFELRESDKEIFESNQSRMLEEIDPDEFFKNVNINELNIEEFTPNDIESLDKNAASKTESKPQTKDNKKGKQKKNSKMSNENSVNENENEFYGVNDIISFGDQALTLLQNTLKNEYIKHVNINQLELKVDDIFLKQFGYKDNKKQINIMKQKYDYKIKGRKNRAIKIEKLIESENKRHETRISSNNDVNNNDENEMEELKEPLRKRRRKMSYNNNNNNNNKNENKNKGKTGEFRNQIETLHLTKNVGTIRNNWNRKMLGKNGPKLNEKLLRALAQLGFEQPTEIQKQVIPKALNHEKRRDILVASETGSGKTLSFGIPIVNDLMNHENELGCDLYALILTPTRELAIQIESHLLSILKYSTIEVGCIVGGMSVAKQTRILRQSPEIIVATPGRLWELFENIDNNNQTERLHLRNLMSLRYLVLDEADRLMSSNHFTELKKLLPLMKTIWNVRSTLKSIKNKHIELNKNSQATKQLIFKNTTNSKEREAVWSFLDENDDSDDDDNDGGDDDVANDNNSNMINENKNQHNNENEKENENKIENKMEEAFNCGTEFERQVFVVSATLTLESINRNKEVESKVPVFGNLLSMIPFENGGQNALIVDLTPRHRTTSKVIEYEIEIDENDKDAMLYYLLLTLHKLKTQQKELKDNNASYDDGIRTLVFANTIGVVKRLSLILKELGLLNNIWCLHSQQQQRQRLKNLDRFIHNSNSILICTDVAARGLDIPCVNNIIHFQCPYSCEDYIHRTGRVGRIYNGKSFLLKAGKNIKMYEKIIIALKRPKGLNKYNINETLFEKIRLSVNIAKQIATIQGQNNKKQRKVTSLSKMAQLAGIELDEINCRALNIKKGNFNDFKNKSKNKKSKGHHSHLNVYGVDNDEKDNATNSQLKSLRQQLAYILKNEEFLALGRSSFVTRMKM